jgi:hydroxymethylbilane synthase
MTVAVTSLRIGTRGSRLALAQSAIVVEALARAHVPARLLTITTEGDRRAPDTAWGEGAFVSSIEAALIAGEIDVAVHSAKDIPTDEDARLTIAAFMPRADARDVLVAPIGDVLDELGRVPQRARVGTDSPRRGAFIRARRPDLRVHPLHGNVDTRLRRLDAGETDILVLAAAGLDRLGLSDRIAVRLSPDDVPPAPGQGALAVQVRADDAEVLDVVQTLDDPATRSEVVAERALLAASGGGCRSPLGALGRVTGTRLELLGGFATLDGSIVAIVRRTGSTASPSGLAREVLGAIMERASAAALERGAPTVIVSRAREQAPPTALALVDRGMAPLLVPAIEIQEGDPHELDGAASHISDRDWVVFTSSNAVRALAAAAARVGRDLASTGARFASVGPATDAALHTVGVIPVHHPPRATSASLAESLPIAPGERVLLPRGDLADDALPTRLRERGTEVHEVVAYRTVEAPDSSVSLLRAALEKQPVAVVLTSGSTVRGLVTLARRAGMADAIAGLNAVAIGSETAREARDSGLAVVAIAPDPAPAAVADTVAAVVAEKVATKQEIQ